jgi:hypothetical protein
VPNECHEWISAGIIEGALDNQAVRPDLKETRGTHDFAVELPTDGGVLSIPTDDCVQRFWSVNPHIGPQVWPGPNAALNP